MLVCSRVGIDELDLLFTERVGDDGSVPRIELDQNLVRGCEERPVGT